MVLSSQGPLIVWFGQDLRLDDHPALSAALREDAPILPVYIVSPAAEGAWPPGAASRWWLHHSLAALDASLRLRGSRLILRAGNPLDILLELARRTQAFAVYRHRRWEPAAARSDERVRAGLERAGIKFIHLNGALLFEPGGLATRQGGPYRVFTPFWNTLKGRSGEIDQPLSSPDHVRAPAEWPESAPLESLGLLPKINWAGGLAESWTPGEAGAEARLDLFVGAALPDYPQRRDRPDLPGTSCLSPHLHFGELSPRRLWHAVREAALGEEWPEDGASCEAFLRQLAWREFAYHQLYHFPHTASEPLRPEFARFPWIKNPPALKAWQRGRTGIPLVDAGMRQLWATGWMHNRVRMIVASVLVKNMLLPWLDGARWFWDTLVDADLANNSFGWQWVAGCGADAVPFFRIFNPVTQGERFDPRGDYVRRWVPELAGLPAEWIHRPHQAPAEVRGTLDYPAPVINLEATRREALIAFSKLKAARKD